MMQFDFLLPSKNISYVPCPYSSQILAFDSPPPKPKEGKLIKKLMQKYFFFNKIKNELYQIGRSINI